MKTKICTALLLLMMFVGAAAFDGSVALVEKTRLTSEAETRAVKFLPDTPFCQVKAAAGFTNVRSQPNLNGRIVGKLDNGTKVYPLDGSTEDDRGVLWIKVRKTPKGKFFGWISFSNLECAG